MPKLKKIIIRYLSFVLLEKVIILKLVSKFSFNKIIIIFFYFHWLFMIWKRRKQVFWMNRKMITFVHFFKNFLNLRKEVIIPIIYILIFIIMYLKNWLWIEKNSRFILKIKIFTVFIYLSIIRNIKT